MLERNASLKAELAPPGATPTLDTQPRRLADFATLGEALDYGAAEEPAGRAPVSCARADAANASTPAKAPKSAARPNRERPPAECITEL